MSEAKCGDIVAKRQEPRISLRSSGLRAPHGVTDAPPPDRRHRQSVSLARSRARRARACRSGIAHGEERVRRRYPGRRARCRRNSRDLCQAFGRAPAPAHALQGDRPLRARGRQYRRQGGGRARHHGDLRAGLLHARGLRPRHGAAAGDGTQDSALQRLSLIHI